MSEREVSRAPGDIVSVSPTKWESLPSSPWEAKIKLRNVAHFSAFKKLRLKHHASHTIHHIVTTISPSQNTPKLKNPLTKPYLHHEYFFLAELQIPSG
ncbi:hypothetical protein [Tunturiibacter psychrotolerans]|uniref:hypothetical protein n=1 Tax=Tunturiibacter psychrotolerans TaxID=3069686 RepID=UPI003D1ECA58